MSLESSRPKLWPTISHKPPFNIQLPNYEKRDGEGIPRRHPGSLDSLKERPDPSIGTLYDIVCFVEKKYGDALCMGSRKLLKTHVEKKMVKKMVNGEETEVPKEWTYYEMSGYEYMSYKEYKRLVDTVGCGLSAIGLAKDDYVQLYAATSSKWLTMAHACASQSMPIVTAYDTLGKQGLTHSLTQAGSKAIFLDSHLLKALIDPLREARAVQYLIYNDDTEPQQDDLDALGREHPRLKIISFYELKKLGEERPCGQVLPHPDDLACIMYTSGSTGSPKGVVLSHKNVVAGVTGVSVIIQPYIGPGDFFLTFLPLAHILEFVFENACLVWGGTMGYGNPRTLSDRAMKNCKGDIRELRPTIIVGVPAVWETVKKGILDQLSKQPVFRQKVFWGAISLKSYLLQAGLPGPALLDAVVLKKIKEATGGRMRLCMNGGGPIAKETHHFISMAIAPMIMGYGLTETSAMGCLMDPAEWISNGALGTLVAAVEVKLVDYPDAGYFSANNPEQGEIWIRGPSVAKSYFKNESETQTAFKDGWFMTGDIGEWNSNGHLRLIDRKKNLVKTMNGEYIALEKLESVYRACPVVANICVYADQSQAKPIAIVVPAEPALKTIAKDQGIKGEHLEDLVSNENLIYHVYKQLLDAGEKGGLSGIELIQGVVLADEEWTPQNNLVTSAQKLNRRGILQKYKEKVDHAYEL